jgi:formylglycine-generating enzyme required for sulfatase activity
VRHAALLALLGACSNGPDTNDAGADGAIDVQTQDVTKPDAGGGDAAKDAIVDAPADVPVEASPCTGVCGTANCGTCPANPGVTAHDSFYNVTFKIDEHEVTNDEYAAFLAVGVPASTQPAVCVFNTSFTPAASWPTDAGANPVANVNWCDALAYCAWANKRLCGSIQDGGALSPVYRDNGDQSEWFNACTAQNGGTGSSGYQRYPYSDTFDASACNGQGYGADATIPVKQAAACLGGIDGGLHDMSGNVAEWENSCVEQDGGPGTCSLRGGAFNDDAGNLQCHIAANAARTQTSATGGIRCCAN